MFISKSHKCYSSYIDNTNSMTQCITGKSHKCYSSYIDNINSMTQCITGKHSRGQTLSMHTYLCLYIIRKVQKHMKLFLFQYKIPQVPTVSQKTN